MARHRIVTAEPVEAEEEKINVSLRPKSMGEYVGQAKLIERLTIALQAVQQRGEAMEHVLLHGPPGLGRPRANRTFSLPTPGWPVHSSG